MEEEHLRQAPLLGTDFLQMASASIHYTPRQAPYLRYVDCDGHVHTIHLTYHSPSQQRVVQTP